MRQTLNNLLSQTIGLKYTLPNTTSGIPKISVSTQSDECYNILTQDEDLAQVIYNGIIDYSYDEKDIDITKLDALHKRALKQKLKFDKKDTVEQQLNYGFYGEVLLFLMLQKFHQVGTFISRGHFYNPLNKRETTGFDTYQMLNKQDGSTELWFGEVKFHKDFRTGITQILDKINNSLSDEYFNLNLIAIEDKECYVNSLALSPVLEAFRNDPDINLAQLAHEQGISFVYPMLVIFNDEEKIYDDIIKSVVRYTNKKYPSLDIDFSLDYSLFFMFLPVCAVKDIKELVRSWILSNQPLI